MPTALVVDALSGTSSGPELHGDAFDLWTRQRQVVNRWLKNPGLAGMARLQLCAENMVRRPLRP